MRTVYILLTLLLLTAATADAQTRYEWAGGAQGDWTEPTNWSPNGVPAATDIAVVTAVVAGNPVTATLTEATTVAGLEITGNSAVGGDFDLRITDRLLWSSRGVDSETFRGTGTVTLATGATGHMAEGPPRFQLSAGRTLVNDGSILWDGSGFWAGSGRLVNNGELLLAMGETTITFSFIADAITNSATGTIRRTADGEATIVSSLVNDGLVRIETGSLSLSGIVTGDGALEVAGAGLLRITRAVSQRSVTGTAVTISTGQLSVSDTYDVATTRLETEESSLTLDIDATLPTLVIEDGTLDGSGTVTVTDSLAWTDGQMGGSGTTVLGPAFLPTIGGTAVIRLADTRTLRTEGPVTWTGDADLAGGFDNTFENTGTLTSSGPGTRLLSFLRFRNVGTLVHDGGTLRFSNSQPENLGTIRIEDGTVETIANVTDMGRTEIAETGRLAHTSGTYTFTETAEVVGTGAVSFTAPVANRATWRPGGEAPGTLTVDSDLPAPEPEAVFDFGIGGPTPGTDFDQMPVTGTANLGGTLRITLTDGFEPEDGDRFLLLPAAAVEGRFDALDLPDGLEAFVDRTDAGAELVIGQPVSSEDEAGEALPTAFALGRAYPNPFAERATLRLDVPTASRVTVAVFDVLGRAVAVLADGERAPGRYEVALDGRGLPSGVYVVRMTAAGFAETRRVTLLH
ncbi:MAG: T9SS type A sorting domain-containing protein [Bacteroidota bacterium]